MSEQATDRENLLRMIQGGDGRRFPFVERVHLRADAAVRVSLFDDGRFIDRDYKGRTL